jgi:hypothetical protein
MKDIPKGVSFFGPVLFSGCCVIMFNGFDPHKQDTEQEDNANGK